VSEGHFNQGEAYYRAGEWSKARTKFQESYEISRLDLLLFNIAQTYIKEGDSVRAIAALKAYLKTTPSDADAQAKLASLEAALPQSAQAPPSQTQALPIPTRAPSASQTPRQTRNLLFLPHNIATTSQCATHTCRASQKILKQLSDRLQGTTPRHDSRMRFRGTTPVHYTRGDCRGDCGGDCRWRLQGTIAGHDCRARLHRE
jgi:tetratricopeptide (TPR) repeat protein